MSFSHGPHARWAGNSLAEFERDLADNLCYERGTTAVSASAQDAYWTLAVTVRDRLADRRARTTEAHYAANPKFVYYLSAEYMLGRQLTQNAVYSGTADLAHQALAGIGWSAADMEALDVEPGLGTGGLGRLAACLLDSLATLDIPAVGYGIRYEWREVKQLNKAALAAYARTAAGVAIDPGSLFDVMAKRLHEYKRQLLKLLHIVTLYNRIKADPAAWSPPAPSSTEVAVHGDIGSPRQRAGPASRRGGCLARAARSSTP